MSSIVLPYEASAPVESPAAPVGPRHRIPGLDGLRAVSILMVIAYHGINSVARKQNGEDYDGLWSMVITGNLGVSVFFVISGFLITQLLLNEMDKTGTVSLKQFYIRRTFRIWPAFYTYLLAVIVIHMGRLNAMVGWIGIGVGDMVAAATFTFDYVRRVGNWWVGHSWSLSVEEQFYLFWPLLLLWTGKKKGVWVAVALLIFAPVARILETAFFPNEWWVARMWQTAHTRVDTLMYGCLLALLWKSPRLQSAIAVCRRYWVAIPALVVPTVGTYCLLRTTPPVIYRGFQYTFEGIAITTLIAILVTADRSWIARIFNSPPMVHLGRISFSLYLWQQMFITSTNRGWSKPFPLNLLCAFVAAELSYHLIEQPALALRAKWFPGSRSKRPVRSNSTN